MTKRILLIEDDRLSREALTNVLTADGHQVFTASSNEEAWDVLKAHAVDVALVDIGLPGLSGDSFANSMRLRHPGVRIIFISGEYRVMDLERFGPDTLFFPKPVDPVTLLDAVQV